MRLGISPKRHREQLEHKLARINARIASMEDGIEPYRREREMVTEMLAIHERHHPRVEVGSGGDAQLEEQLPGDAPAMLKEGRAA